MNIDFSWLLILWLLFIVVAIMLYLKWTAPILDRWNNLLRRSNNFVILSATAFLVSSGMFFCKPKFRPQTALLPKPQPDISSPRRAISSTY